MNNSLSMDVQMQFMRPAQLETALREFPIIYVPFGLIEWHLLESLPENQRAFNLSAISPEHWWSI